jgi:hypothetical protein
MSCTTAEATSFDSLEGAQLSVRPSRTEAEADYDAEQQAVANGSEDEADDRPTSAPTASPIWMPSRRMRDNARFRPLPLSWYGPA